MDFLKKLFLSSQPDSPYMNQLHEKINDFLKVDDPKATTKLAAIAGLLSRVAYSDLDIREEEKEKIAKLLLNFSDLDEASAQFVTKIALDETQELAGLDDHVYGRALTEVMDENERYRLLEALFLIASSDNEVSNQESEEIRLIGKSLLLEQKHFVAARAKVKEYLGALKG